MTDALLKALIDQGVVAALASRDADRSMNGDDSHNSGTGVKRTERVTRECTYLDFMKCQPINFKALKELTVGHDVAYAMTWVDLKKKITKKYYSRGEIKKLKVKLCNLKVKVSDKIERYVSGLPDMIHESVVASKPKTMQEAIEMATELLDKKISTFAECQTENKRKQDDNNNQAQQQPPKKQGVAIAYIARPGKRKEYARTLPLCNKWIVHFGKRGKLNPRYVGSFKVLEKVRSIAYKLKLPQEPSRVHNTFHVSNLKKCYANKPLAIPLEGLHINDKLHFVEEPVKIIDHEVK
uniref:Putative reverse transcriptase domain-containing protein n=1 Tax=Tanacetum cinerariifolium TaxID=118510 RepID=A0A6L2LAF0_TANCI|nr:putative reverse transcriptase domain-containing protein [Tanacetum cinerariifolium]